MEDALSFAIEPFSESIDVTLFHLRSPTPLLAAARCVLDGRALHAPIRAEYAAVSRLRAEQGAAPAALVEEQAGVRWHELLPSEATVGAGQYGRQDDLGHDAFTGGCGVVG